MSDPKQFPAPFKVYPYLSHVPTRRPVQKLHSSLGNAKNAIYGSGMGYNSDFSERIFSGGQIYEWNELLSEWELIYDVHHGTPLSKLPWK